MGTSFFSSSSHSQFLHIGTGGEKNPHGLHKDGSALHKHCGSWCTTASYPDREENWVQTTSNRTNFLKSSEKKNHSYGADEHWDNRKSSVTPSYVSCFPKIYAQIYSPSPPRSLLDLAPLSQHRAHPSLQLGGGKGVGRVHAIDWKIKAWVREHCGARLSGQLMLTTCANPSKNACDNITHSSELWIVLCCFSFAAQADSLGNGLKTCPWAAFTVTRIPPTLSHVFFFRIVIFLWVAWFTGTSLFKMQTKNYQNYGSYTP